jgi:hypothetical protein
MFGLGAMEILILGGLGAVVVAVVAVLAMGGGKKNRD